MKKIILATSCFALFFIVCSCPFNDPDPEYELDMYISLGLAGSYPAGHPVASLDDLAEFGGKTVYFTLEGLDFGINESIDFQRTAEFGWTGGNIESSTQYAGITMDLSENTMYLSGRYKFRMFIDWDGDGLLSSGDLYFGSYSILADKDDDEETASLLVSSGEYGSGILYNSTDYSITINDPLSVDNGLAWIVTAIHEGELLVYSE